MGNSATSAIVTPSCSTYQYATALSQDARTNGMLKVGYDLSDKFKLTGDVNISDRHSKTPAARGTITGVRAFRRAR